MSARMFERKNPKLKSLIAPSILFAVVVMLGFQAIQGERGYLSLFGLEQKRIRAESELKTLTQKNELVLRDINLLSGDYPDLDFLDERTRAVLGFVENSDTVLILR